jgi:hyperosmotically inducible protein
MYHRIRRVARACAVLGGALILSAPSLIAQTPADNTKVNSGDRAPGAVTADQQKDNASDRMITQKIRQSLMRDKGLSSYAHNVKVIAQDGHVTLKGPVRTDEEKQTVAAKAVEIAGATHVTNEITIVPLKKKATKP